MSTWLYLLPAGLADPGPQWPCLLYRAGEPARPLSLADAVGGGHMRVVLPMEMFGWLQTQPWPGRRPSALAVAYALEEQIAGDIDTLQLFLTPPDALRRHCLWFTERTRFAALLALLRPLQPDSVCIDADLLPKALPCGRWWGGRWLLGGALPARLAVPASGREALQAHLPADMTWLDAEEHWAPSAPGFDVLGGKGRALAWPWRSLVASAALMWLLAGGFTALRTQHVDHQLQALSTANDLRFGQLLPQHAHVSDVATRLRIAAQPPTASAGSDMVRLMTLAASLAGSADLQLQRITLRPGQGWTLDVSVSHLQALEQLKARSPLPVQVRSATQEQGRVQATLDVEGVQP